MRGIGAFALSAAFFTASASAADKAPCPPHEAGAFYPWQNSGMVKGDKYAWVYIDVDRTGRPLRCKIGENNIFDEFARFQLCNAYTADWRAPAASPGDPDTRTIKKQTIMIGSDHQLADQKARRAWFKAHPEERSECYPD
jgi:hypothetical protein